ALHATRAAVEEGIVPGGGVAFLRVIPSLDKLKLDGDEAVGVNIIRKALEAPTRFISENAGVEGPIVLNKIRNGEGPFGYNAETDDYVDMFAAGVIDPTKVTRTALENAASISALLLTTEAMVTDKPEKKDAAGMPPGMPPGGGYGDMY
ncbi:MAG: chaperonin GroEL, partial [candidate division Zixibacteria bacterium]|nr:chaperonin GroEL [candidate division Zixibacteria bacterium]